MLDRYSKLSPGTLAETVAWCSTKTEMMDMSSDQVRERQARYSLAEQQWNEAIQIMEQRHLGSVSGITQYQHAVALLKENQVLLGPMDRILRSPELQPTFGLDRFEDDSLWVQAVKEVVTYRARLVAGPASEQPVGDPGGRFLLYSPSENLACGAAAESSNGFFDMNNVPPWDLWLGFSDGTLVSWVPPALIDVASMGIFVNPEECVRWAESH